MTDIDNYFLTRCTVRNFSSEKVEKELIIDILQEAMHAPNTGNMQLYSVIITTDEKNKAELAKHHFNQPASTGCSALITFCIDINRFGKWASISNADMGFNNIQMLLAAAIDTALLAQQFNTIAELKGLGCCYLGTTAYNAPSIAKELGLPDGVIPLISLAVGYASSTPAPTYRLPVSAIVHDEKYHDYDNTAIAKMYAPIEQREDSAMFIKENDKENLAQVFTEVRYPRTTNEEFSKILEKYLKETFYK